MRAGTRQVALLNPAQPRTLVHDAFTDTNGTALASHVIRPVNTVGGSWTVFGGGGVEIQGNQANTRANYTGATLDLGTPDAEVVLTFTANTIAQVIGRYADATHHIYVQIQSDIRIYDYQGTAKLLAQSAAITLTNGVEYTVRVTFAGNTVRARVDGFAPEASTDSVAATATRFGFYAVFFNSYFNSIEMRTVAAVPVADNINLRNGLVAYWPMSEASGDRADAHGGHTLTDSAGAASNTGIVYANALDLPTADNKALTTAGGDFDFGDAYFTVGLWLYPYSLPEQYTYRPVLGHNYGNNEGGWHIKLAYNEALAFGIATTNGSVGFAHAQGCAINTWHCCLFWHDPVANTVNGARNNLTPETLSWSAGMTLSGQPLTVGAHVGAGANTDYRLGPVAVWRRLLTAAEKARWLNWGTGAPYAGLR